MRQSVLLMVVWFIFAAASQAVENAYDVKDVTYTVTLSAEQFPPGLHGESPEQGFSGYIFENNTPLKVGDSTDSKTIMLLQAGLPVQVLAPTVRTAERNHFREKWFEVEIATGGAALLRGYVWGGSLSYASAKNDVDRDGKEELFLAGIIGFDGFNKTVELRLIKNGIVSGQCSFSAIETTFSEDTERFFSYRLSVEPFEKEGFTPPVRFIKVQFEYPACDFMNGSVLCTWNGKTLNYGATATSLANEQGGSREEFLFPGEHDGDKNLVVLRRASQTRQGDEAFRENSVFCSSHTWNGTNLVKQ